MSQTAIADHALISDRHSSALVTTAGSVEWLSFPRFDSPSVFGRLLGEAAGHWQIQPAGEWRSSRRYVDRTLVLETTFTTETGTVALTDLLIKDTSGDTGLAPMLGWIGILPCSAGLVAVALLWKRSS